MRNMPTIMPNIKSGQFNFARGEMSEPSGRTYLCKGLLFITQNIPYSFNTVKETLWP